MSHSADRCLASHCTDTLNRVVDTRNALVLEKRTKTPEFRRAHRNYLRVGRLWLKLVREEDATYQARKEVPHEQAL